MINNDLFITVVVMFLLSFVAILLLLIVLIFVFVNSYKQKTFKISPVQIWLSILSFIILYLGTPFWILAFAQNAKQSQAEQLYKLAVSVSVIPSVKANILEELGNHYVVFSDGQNAVKAFEDALDLNESKIATVQLCRLYTIKGEYNSAINMCQKLELLQIIAVNYILQDDYKIAYEVINKKIQNNKKPTCWDYATRAYIYRQTGKKDLFEKNYKKALELCPDSEALKNLYKNKNYYKDLYSQYKKQYNF